MAAITIAVVSAASAGFGIHQAREQRRQADEARRDARRAAAEQASEDEAALRRERDRRQRAVQQFAARQRSLGPVQLQAPTLNL